MSYSVVVESKNDSWRFSGVPAIPTVKTDPVLGGLLEIGPDEDGEIASFPVGKIVCWRWSVEEAYQEPPPSSPDLAQGGFTPRKKNSTAAIVIFYSIVALGLIGILASLWAMSR